MTKIICKILFVLIIFPFISHAQTIDVHIKGLDDGIKTTKGKDYKEAVLYAKREAIKRAGIKIKLLTTVKNLVLNSDYIESKAEEVLLPGYDILDIGYMADSTYEIVLIGKVKTVVEGIDSKELRYAKSLVKRGKLSKAKKIITYIIRNNKDEKTVVEAMYYQVIWGFSPDPMETLEMMKAFYPESKYVSKLQSYFSRMTDKEKKELTIKAKIGEITDRDRSFFLGDKGVVLDTTTNLMWAAKDNGKDINWMDANKYCKTYRGGGYNDWRMPALNELVNLYDSSKINKHGYFITKLIEITGPAPWSSNTNGNNAFTGYFSDTGPVGMRGQTRYLLGRALPVRDSNK